MRNRRDPSRQPSSRPGASNKPKVKSSAAERESEGIEVLSRAAKKNVAGGKGPCGGQAEVGGTREGMAGGRRPNHPDRRSPVDKVQQLQQRLGKAAKESPGRRFHALYDRIWRSDVLQEAWKRVKRNKGAAGVDAQTIVAIEEHGVERFLEEIQSVLREGEYRPQAVFAAVHPEG
jgi:RNA-directed DNA polymerase